MANNAVVLRLYLAIGIWPALAPACDGQTCFKHWPELSVSDDDEQLPPLSPSFY